MNKAANANQAAAVAVKLLEIEAVTLRPQQPFTWSSGWKSPIYCDNRLTLSYPEVRSLIADQFVALIHAQFPGAEVIAGTSTAGIPHAAWVAERMDLPMVYIRDKAKGHGKQNKIEGRLAAGQKVVVIEDLISTGGSSLNAAAAVKEAGGEVLGVCAIFTYEFAKAAQAFEDAKLALYCLSDYSTLIQIALEKNRVQPEDADRLQQWRLNPESYV